MPFSLVRQHIYRETLFVAGPVLKGLFRVFSECEVLAFAYRKLGNVRMLVIWLDHIIVIELGSVETLQKFAQRFYFRDRNVGFRS